ncbi:MAG: Ig-like domain-containing protein, partial [Clostridia bacterium]|nr:Ig-like domain-containing protein [Clostridia bacterium]
GEDSTAIFIQNDTTRNSPEDSSDPTPDITTQPSTGTEPGTTPDVTGEVSDTEPADTGTEQTTPVKPDPPVVIENPTAPSHGGGLTALSATIPAELESLTVTAESGNSGLIPVNATFIVRTARPATAAAIASAVSVTPATAMSVTTISDTEFRLTPASGDLVPGKIYKFTLGDPDSPAASFSFQTEKKLAVTSILPANDSRSVPLNTGIEVAFTEAINPADASNAFSITPSVKGKTMLYPDGRTVAFIPDKALSYGTVYTVTVRAGVRSASGKTLAESKVAKFMTITRDEETQRQKYGNSQSGYLFIDCSAANCHFSPGEEAKAAFYAVVLAEDSALSNWVIETACDLYACPSAASAADFWNLTDSERYGKTLEALMSPFTFIGSFDGEGAGYEYYDYTVSFGNALPRGTYIAVSRVKVTFADGSEVSDYAFQSIQITDVRTEFAIFDDSICVWAVKTDGAPVQGAQVALTLRQGHGVLPSGDEPQTFQAITGEDGAAVFNVNPSKTTFVLSVESGEDAS